MAYGGLAGCLECLNVTEEILLSDSIAPHRLPQIGFSELARSVLVPSTKIAARWSGALQRRLNRMPLETLLRAHRQPCIADADTALDENLTVATEFLLKPSLTHIHDWQMLCSPSYFAAFGRVVGTVSFCLAALIIEPHAWRVAALRATARMLSPVFGPDAAPVIAADAVGSFKTTLDSGPLESSLGQHVACALASCNLAHLTALRHLAVQELAKDTLSTLAIARLAADDRVPTYVAANT